MRAFPRPNISHEQALDRAVDSLVATEAAVSALADKGLVRIWRVVEIDTDSGLPVDPAGTELLTASLSGAIDAARNLVIDTLVPIGEIDAETRRSYVRYLADDVTWEWDGEPNDMWSLIGYPFIITSPQGQTYWTASWMELLP